MKKLLSLLLCFCAAASLTAAALASDDGYRMLEEYTALYGSQPQRENFASDLEYDDACRAWLSGLEDYVRGQTAAQRQAPAEQAPVSETTLTESAGAENEDDPPVSHAPGSAGQYPDRVRVDLAGNIYSLDGELLSPGTTPASGPEEDGAEESADPAGISPVSDADTLAVIAGLVSDIAEDPPVWYVEDLRTEKPPAVLDGMKALVTSIFGEYTPITTTAVVTETVGNDTHQYLVETVASGAAGVDYEWLASVFLFGILLFCLMKLLGGVLK